MTDKLRIAVVGAGYWGPNLARNFRSNPEWELTAICDIDQERAEHISDLVGGVPVITRLDALLARDDLDAIAIATPARTHHDIAVA
jgi:predicted dehydrogenase